MKKILFLNGPNLNLLGIRERDVYGRGTLEEIRALVEGKAEKLGVAVEFKQSNHEGEIIDDIHRARGVFDGIVINPGAYTHYSIAIRDALKAVDMTVVEIHLSNIYNREEFRKKSVIAPVAAGQISGFGGYGYILALDGILELLEGKK